MLLALFTKSGTYFSLVVVNAELIGKSRFYEMSSWNCSPTNLRLSDFHHLDHVGMGYNILYVLMEVDLDLVLNLFPSNVVLAPNYVSLNF